MFDKKKRRALKKKYKNFRKASTDMFNFLFSLKGTSRLVNDKEIRVIGMKRTGNHAIINWIFAQVPEKKCFLNYVAPNKNPFISFHKQGTVTEFPQEDFYEKFNLKAEQLGFFSRKKALIYSYEDDFLEDIASPVFEKNHDRWVGKSAARFELLILRDPFNLFASRLKLEARLDNVIALRNDRERKTVIDMWKQYAHEMLNHTDILGENKVTVNYNKWVTDVRYRKKLAETLKIEFTDEKAKEVIPVGGGSSFDQDSTSSENMKLFERWKHFRDDKLFRSLFDDRELLDLSDELFGEIPGVKEWLAK
jgi:hypothetical protein